MPKANQLLDALTNRVPFRTARRLLVASDYPTGQGWDAVREKLKNPVEAAKANPSQLRNLYIESIVASEKAIRLYRLSKNDRDVLLAKLESRLALDASQALSVSYPFPLPASVLKSQVSTDPVVVGKVGIADGDIFVISYIREYSFRVSISASQIKPLNGAVYKDAYALQVERVQSFDAILIPKRMTNVFLLTDCPQNVNLEMLNSAFARVRSFVKAICRKDIFLDPVNLFSSIAPFYADPAVQVTALNHTSPDSSLRTERMRGSQVCLRDADFHKAGMAAQNGVTDAYGIEVLWKLDSVGRLEARPELSISGSYNTVHSLNPTILHAHLSKAATYAELSVVLKSLYAKV